MLSRALMIALLPLCLAVPAAAQDAEASRRAQQRTAANPATVESPALTTKQKRDLAMRAREAAELRIENDMVTMTSLVEALAKNIGQIHYLRTLCFGLNDQKWRDYGQSMMSTESNGNADRHRQLVRAFNAGYYQEKERHASCSNAVSVDVAALAENGRHISSMLGDPYRER